MTLGLLLGAAVAACADPPPQPRAVDTGKLAEADLVEAVLTECHAPLRGQMDRIAARVTLPDGRTARLYAHLPTTLRAVLEEDRFLAIAGEVFRLDGALAGQAPPAATAAEAAEVLALLALLDAAALGPLHRASGCRRRGPAEFELAQPTGAPFVLHLRPNSLLPASLVGPAGAVVFGEHLRTPTTWMVARASSAALGSCAVVFEQSNVEWEAGFFTPPTAAAPAQAGRRRTQYIGDPAFEPRTELPIEVEGRACEWVLLDDPGTWPERAAIYQPVHAELLRQQQIVAGFPILFADDGGRRLAVPFRPRDPKVRLVPPADWRIVGKPATRLLVVHPPTGDLDERTAAGCRLLRADLAARGLTADGPFCAQPYLHLDEGTPDAAELRSPTVRVSVPVR